MLKAVIKTVYNTKKPSARGRGRDFYCKVEKEEEGEG